MSTSRPPDPVELLQAAQACNRDALGRRGRELADDLDGSSLALGAALPAAQCSPSKRAAQRERAVLLADAIISLPGDYGEVIILRHLEGLPLADVAERMGRSVDSVKKLWVRGIARLRGILADQEQGDLA
jgi:RNA polymerase sigma-70 factor (ECF subfamily)